MDNQDRVDLKDYLESLEDVPDPFEGIPIPPAPEETSTELTQANRLAAYVRMRSKGAQLACKSAFAAELEWDETVEIDQVTAEMLNDPSNEDIRHRKGTKNDYYYSITYMSDNFAMIAALVLDKNIPKTIVDMVRFNEKTYHLPTSADKFTQYPYFFTQVQVEQAIITLMRQEENKDIGKVETGNKKVYLFHDTQAMPPRLAKALAEENEKDEFGRYW